MADKRSELLQTFLQENPTCNPENENYVGKIIIDCKKDGPSGGFCALASSFGQENSAPSCKNSVAESVQDAINGTFNDDGTQKSEGLKTCQSKLYSTFVSSSITKLETDQNYIFQGLLSQQKNFDSYLDLVSAEVDNEIDLENLVSGTVFILALVIIIYLLFSKIFL